MALLLFACALLFTVLGLPLARGAVRPNRLYGMRTQATLSDERVWFPANRAYGRAEVAGGIALLVVALVAKTVALPDHPVMIVLIVAAAKLPSIFIGLRAAKRAQAALKA